ncbi:hypothetical protein [Chromobacterium piscinae]|uniref:hypothetical protein n=1 Tax=Chromobacterium piscinae TaxID=686831 RepID=UPI003F7E85C9
MDNGQGTPVRDRQSEKLIRASLWLVGAFAVLVIVWIVAEVCWIIYAAVRGVPACGADAYWVVIIQESSSLFKRSLGLLGGLAVMFSGVATSFAVAKRQEGMYKTAAGNDLDNLIKLESAGFKATLITASPGLFALVCGAFVICFVIASKDQSGGYSAAGFVVDEEGTPYCVVPSLKKDKA